MKLQVLAGAVALAAMLPVLSACSGSGEPSPADMKQALLDYYPNMNVGEGFTPADIVVERGACEKQAGATGYVCDVRTGLNGSFSEWGKGYFYVENGRWKFNTAPVASSGTPSAEHMKQAFLNNEDFRFTAGLIVGSKDLGERARFATTISAPPRFETVEDYVEALTVETANCAPVPEGGVGCDVRTGIPDPQSGQLVFGNWSRLRFFLAGNDWHYQKLP